jgi:adenylate cyclase
MATEIERKFLVANENWKSAAEAPTHYRQGYLSTEGRAAIRVRLSDKGAVLTIKASVAGTTRAEFEYDMPAEDAHELLDNFCVGTVIEKSRYCLQHQGHLWEIDVFAGDNAGLVMAEVELKSEAEDIQRPDWLGEEVTGDARYYNDYLAKHPYRHWQENEQNN